MYRIFILISKRTFRSLVTQLFLQPCNPVNDKSQEFLVSHCEGGPEAPGILYNSRKVDFSSCQHNRSADNGPVRFNGLIRPNTIVFDTINKKKKMSPISELFLLYRQPQKRNFSLPKLTTQAIRFFRHS